MTTELPFVIHRSSVNAWECDENGHLNVRYFIGKNYQGLVHLLAEIGLTPRVLDKHNAQVRLVSQHIRLHREVLLAVPLTISGAVVEQRPSRLQLYSEVRHTKDGSLFTTFSSDIVLVDRQSQQPITVAYDPVELVAALPTHGEIKSLFAEEKPALSISAALDNGYVETGRGTVMTEECDANGEMETYQYTGRIADAIPTFMSTMQSDEEFALRSAGKLGGAVVENRVDYFAPLARGNRFIILSGLRSFTAKTQRLTHLVFNLDNDCLVLHSQGIAVALDLQTRRAVPFSEDRRARMTKRQLRVE